MSLKIIIMTMIILEMTLNFHFRSPGNFESPWVWLPNTIVRTYVVWGQRSEFNVSLCVEWACGYVLTCLLWRPRRSRFEFLKLIILPRIPMRPRNFQSSTTTATLIIRQALAHRTISLECFVIVRPQIITMLLLLLLLDSPALSLEKKCLHDRILVLF